MNNDNKQHNHLENNHGEKPLWFFANRIFVFIIIAVIGYYLITEHKAHIGEFFASFPWWILVLLLCPLMHLMHGHRGHGKNEDHHSHKKDDEDSPEKRK